MELLKEISEIDIGIADEVPNLPDNLRKAARMILFNDMNQIAILFVSKDKYHKLPGGGIEKNESVIESLDREVMEEVGAKAEILGEVGLTIEYRGQFIQISYCYYGKVVGELEKTSFTDEELDDGFELKWMDLSTAINILNIDKPVNNVGKYINRRDLCLLKGYKDKFGIKIP